MKGRREYERMEGWGGSNAVLTPCYGPTPAIFSVQTCSFAFMYI